MNNDIERLSVYALRYAMGRSSYAPADVIDILMRNWESLSSGCKEVIRRDVDGYLEESPEDTCWVNFYAWILTKRKNVDPRDEWIDFAQTAMISHAEFLHKLARESSDQFHAKQYNDAANLLIVLANKPIV